MEYSSGGVEDNEGARIETPERTIVYWTPADMQRCSSCGGWAHLNTCSRDIEGSWDSDEQHAYTTCKNCASVVIRGGELPSVKTDRNWGKKARRRDSGPTGHTIYYAYRPPGS
jgi:hypothetical protein